MLNGNRAWAILLVLITIYEITCKDGELLSEAVDRFLVRFPFLTHFVVMTTALHLLNVYDLAPPPFRYLDLFRLITLARHIKTCLSDQNLPPLPPGTPNA